MAGRDELTLTGREEGSDCKLERLTNPEEKQQP